MGPILDPYVPRCYRVMFSPGVAHRNIDAKTAQPFHRQHGTTANEQGQIQGQLLTRPPSLNSHRGMKGVPLNPPVLMQPGMNQELIPRQTFASTQQKD